MNLKKIEKIAADLEQALGLDEAGNELIDKAEEAVEKGEETLPETIEKNIEDEKKEEAIPESPLEASEENAKEIVAEPSEGEIEDAQQLKKDIEELDQQLGNTAEAPAEDAPEAEAPAEAPADAPAEAENPALEEVVTENAVADDESDEIDAEGAKACIASMQKLLKIAKAVRMSKDMPATKKAEILGRIQKASEGFRNAAREDATSDSVVDMKDLKNNVSGVNPQSLKKNFTRAIQVLKSRPSMKLSDMFKKYGVKLDANISVSRLPVKAIINLLEAIENTIVQ